MRHIAYTIMAAVLFSSTAAAAAHHLAIELAGDLDHLCQRTDDGAKAVCFGFIGGVFDVTSNNTIDGMPFCVPPLTHISKIRVLTLEWIESHPEKRVEPAYLAVAEAIAASFPCKKVR